jgi:two-component system, NarL family, sensor kinase
LHYTQPRMHTYCHLVSITGFNVGFFLLGTIITLLITIAFFIVFIIFHQRKIIRLNAAMHKLVEDQQRLMLDASLKLQEEERERFAADLHDDAGPMLATAKLYLNDTILDLPKQELRLSIANARSIIDDTIQLVRNISHSLTPPTLKSFGLESALTDFFSKLSGSGKIKASISFNDYTQRMTVEQETVVYRIIQELTNNILKHSAASELYLSQYKEEHTFYIRIFHNGNGMLQNQFEEYSANPHGLGLKNIHSRLQVARGKIMFERNEDEKYQVTVAIPLQEVSSLT